jgi:hypothetical protein
MMMAHEFEKQGRRRGCHVPRKEDAIYRFVIPIDHPDINGLD